MEPDQQYLGVVRSLVNLGVPGEVAQILVGVICAAVFLGAIGWQGYIYWKCAEDFYGDVPRYFRTPALVGAGITLFTVTGSGGYIVLAWIDPEITANGWALGKVCLGVLLLSVCFCLKSYIGAALLGATATWSFWNLMIHAEWTFIPIFRLVFQLVAEALPEWAYFVYVSLTLIYSIGASIYGSFAE